MMEKQRTAAIFGLWWSSNYGSQMTYYSLNRLVESFGYSVFMIDRPGFSPDNPLFHTHGRRFAREHYRISPSCDFKDLKKLNEKADTFLMGSDQVWNFSICRHYRGAFYLNFVQDDKKKIAYGASFGHPGFFAPEEEIEKARRYLSRFDAISVREEDAVGIVNHTFGLKAVRVLDPVFAVDPAEFEPILAAARVREEEPYLAAYILDPDEKKREALRYLAEKLGLKLVIMLDGERNFEENKQKMALDGVVGDLQVEEWLSYIKNCRYFVTDSCHGASFAILFQKNFVCFGNEGRGNSRMDSLAHVFELPDRFLKDPEMVKRKKSLLKAPDYKKVSGILEREREVSRSWLREALEMPVKPEKDNLYQEQPRPVHDFLAGTYKKYIRPVAGEGLEHFIRKVWR
ncbi:MAG: polysaccharide pyruvyl transferase family protein [Candidatus Limivivens sp.]|nr:polysaccharide pyruvyl transferase family protein [Candidatus Limivivens sp.]